MPAKTADFLMLAAIIAGLYYFLRPSSASAANSGSAQLLLSQAISQ
jgi:hypothetical protein